jgi:Domain of unknown function (DUF4397)
MRSPSMAIRLAVTAAVALAAALLAAPAAFAASGTGWVRLAHLSPNTPAVDVYLYSFGDSHARLVLRHVSYGEASPYEQLPAGEYTVAMRAAGAAASTKPVISTAVSVTAGQSYTVAGMGPASGLRLRVIDDTLAIPAGHALVRVIQASLKQHDVTVSLGGTVLSAKLAFGGATSYRPVPSGGGVARVDGSSEHASLPVSLPAGTSHTLVVLDGKTGLKLLVLENTAGSANEPEGGAATGFGGTAPRPAPSPLPWLLVIAAGVLVTGAGAARFRRARPAAGRGHWTARG